MRVRLCLMLRNIVRPRVILTLLLGVLFWLICVLFSRGRMMS